jgi:hypothetical protein
MKTYFQFKKMLLEMTSEDWENQTFYNDVTDKIYSVKEVYDFAKKHPECLVPDFPINKTDALKWWDKSYSMDSKHDRKRMEAADTSMPILGIRIPGNKDKISVADGMNRVKKAHDIEGKKTIPAYVIDMKDIESLGKNPPKK